MGAVDSVVSRGIEDSAAREAGLQNLVTARDLALTLQALVAGTAAGRRSCHEILDVLAAQQINDAIPALLPAGRGLRTSPGGSRASRTTPASCTRPDAAPFVVVVCTTSDTATSRPVST